MSGVVIAIVASTFLGGPIAFPGLLPSTATQTLSQTTTTQATGPPLQVQITIARNPVSAGSTQVVIVVVNDPNGNAISDASVSVEVLPPTGDKQIFGGLTGTDGQYVHSWHISASSGIGTFQVAVSATKAGYQTGQAQATFESIAT